jgi:hypothetical protein
VVATIYHALGVEALDGGAQPLTSLFG